MGGDSSVHGTVKPSVSPLTLKRLDDLLDFEVEHILHDYTTRLQHYDSLVYFWSLHPAQNIALGRRYVRMLLAEILVVAYSCSPYNVNEDDDQEPGQGNERFESLYKFDRTNWENLENDLSKIRSLLLRKDASKDYLHDSDVTEDGAEEVIARKKIPAFSEDFDSVIQSIQRNKAIAPIRKALEDQIAGNLMLEFSDTISQRKIDEILEFVIEVADDGVQNKVLQLFEQSPNGCTFVEREKVVQLLRSETFCLEFLQKKIETLVLDMDRTVFPSNRSILLRLEYTIEPGSNIREKLRPTREKRPAAASRASAGVSALQSSRATLKHGHGPDPLEEALALSKAAGGRAKKRKASAAPCEPPSRELSEDGSEELPTPARLSPPPKRRRKSYGMRKIKSPGSIPPDAGLFGDDGRALKRRPWSDEEKACIKAGVRKHGFGKWALIKSEFALVLRNRTNVQIKDCFRTMLEKGEFPKEELPQKIDPDPGPVIHSEVEGAEG